MYFGLGSVGAVGDLDPLESWWYSKSKIWFEFAYRICVISQLLVFNVVIICQNWSKHSVCIFVMLCAFAFCSINVKYCEYA